MDRSKLIVGKNEIKKIFLFKRKMRVVEKLIVLGFKFKELELLWT